MPVPRSRAAIAAAFAIALTGAGAGCSDDGSDEASTTTTVALEAVDDAAVDEGTGERDDEDDEEDEEDGGASTTTTVAGVAAATGPVLEQPLLSLRMPEGWELDENQASFLSSGNSGDLALGNMGLSQLPSANPASTIDDVERAMIDSRFQGQGSVLPRVEVAGVEMVHVAGPSGMRVDEAYGALVDGQIVNIVISLRPEIPEAERRAIIDSVLASVTWN
jgi:hypothetical protein